MPSFYARLADAASRFPQRTAIELVSNGPPLVTTYDELFAHAARVAGWLEAAGITAGDRVAILAANDARWIAAYIGILRHGAIAVPLDTAYTADQVATIAADSGARAVLTTPKYQAAAGASGVLLDDVLVASPTTRPPADRRDDDAAMLLYTSGTTADPKGVVLTHANLDAERRAAFGVVHVTEEDAVLGVLPLFHALAQMANLLLPLSVGARVVFLDVVDSASLLGALQTRDITIFACVPQFFYLIHQRVMNEIGRKGALSERAFRALLAASIVLRDRLGWNPGRRIFRRVHRALGSHMRFLVTGGSRFDPDIARDLYGMGFSLLNAYGLTETSGGATMVRQGDRFTTSVGQPFPGVDVRIDQGGEILIRGGIVMREYFHRPDATAETLDDGWLHTGDLGRMDSEGRLYITGRLKEIIVLSSGKNLYPEEIEAHYRKSPFIKELAVLGLSRPGAPAAERLHAVIVPDEAALRDRGIVNIRELVRFELEGLSVHLPAYKRILTYDIRLDPLPRTTTGKLRRHEIEKSVHERAATTDAARPLTDVEREWARTPEHAALLQLVAERLQAPDVRPDANLELDLGLDSMERVEMLAALEAARGTRVSPETRATIFTVRQLVDAVNAGAAAAAPDAGVAETALPWDRVLAEAPDPALSARLRQPKLIRAAIIYAGLRGLRVVLRLVCSISIDGVNRLPASGPVVISPNHESYFDGVLVCAALPFRLFRRIFFVGAAEYFESPLMAWLARAINIVPVDPDANLVQAMRAGAAGLREGKVLILFPEGERSIDGTLKRFRKGAAILAGHLGTPIVPVGIDGLFELWPRERPFQWRTLVRRPRLMVAFGSPLHVARGEYTEGTRALETAVRALATS